jgi:hypothetical protein
MAAAPAEEATVDPRIRAVDPAVEAISLRLLPTPEVLGTAVAEEEEEGAIPPLTAAAIPPPTRAPLATLVAAAAVAIPPLTRTPLAAVGATRAEEAIPTRAPRAALPTRLLATL